MQGISILRDSTGQATVLAVDLRQHDERLNEAIQNLLREAEELETANEREFWYRLGAEGLGRAYGDDEPEYTDADLIERNPNYRPRP